MSQDTDKVPAILRTGFNCPHCNAYAAQVWMGLHAMPYDDSETSKTPYLRLKEKHENSFDDGIGEEYWADLLDKTTIGKPFIESKLSYRDSKNLLINLNISKCYQCKEITVWCHDQIIYPASKIDIQPNEDMPDHIAKPFEEARGIVYSSPRGAAALLRLCIQYLCIELGESGKNINQDIANLASKGLAPNIQKALDIVRVIGNESVHPGEINIDDSSDIALKLLNLVNLITEQMISLPKRVDAMYKGLPKKKLEEIEQRDKKVQSKKPNK